MNIIIHGTNGHEVELIETLWNVNVEESEEFTVESGELIETLWNVN